MSWDAFIAIVDCTVILDRTPAGHAGYENFRRDLKEIGRWFLSNLSCLKRFGFSEKRLLK
ncbi:MAG: hypothetical protein HC889_18875 [Synechococcaceae cyanobacterium SM1_2_3]|nr:hypothetical protein [Synechococcaceae cyanobacterium SM1_2_3]